MGEFKPFDIKKIKDAIKSVGKKPAPDRNEELFTMALALTAAIKKLLFEKSETKFSDEPVIEKKPITQFVKRMRVDGPEKFQATTFISVVHFHKKKGEIEGQPPAGVVVVYIDRKFVPEMLRLLKYPYIDYDDDAEVLDGMGAIANLIAGHFKKELAKLGYPDLEMSPFKSYINNAVDGIDYPNDQNEKYEISFKLDDKKRMVVEMIMVSLSKIPGL